MSSAALKAILTTWAMPGSCLDFDFVNDRCAIRGASFGSCANLLSLTRTTPAWADGSDGIWRKFASGAIRRTDKGLLCEEARTNIVLWCRDLTNAAWTKTNITAALDQVGIDGQANLASSLTATAGNGTCLQAITSGSATRWQSVWVKRISGSGTINMTMDNGTTWTAIAVTSAWSQLSIPSQTLANPTVGFRIVTSGDAIAVDFAQNEASATPFGTSPMLTTSASTTRNADTITLIDTSMLSFGPGGIFAQYRSAGPIGQAANIAILRIDGNNLIHVSGNNASNQPQLLCSVGGVTQAQIFSTNPVVANTRYRVAARYNTNDFAIACPAALKTNVGTDTVGTIPSGAFTVSIGNNGVPSSYLNSFLERLTFFPYAPSDADLLAYAQASFT